jgi:hypothetical protein
MYINNTAANTYKVEMNSKEYQAFSKVFETLIFNKLTNVSNAFRLEDNEIEIVKSISGQLYVANRPKPIY